MKRAVIYVSYTMNPSCIFLSRHFIYFQFHLSLLGVIYFCICIFCYITWDSINSCNICVYTSTGWGFVSRSSRSCNAQNNSYLKNLIGSGHRLFISILLIEPPCLNLRYQYCTFRRLYMQFIFCYSGIFSSCDLCFCARFQNYNLKALQYCHVTYKKDSWIVWLD